jgi:hypothetical protein
MAARDVPPPTLPPQLVDLVNVILSGVQQVTYADRTIKYAGIGDLLKALSVGSGILGVGVGGPVRRYACFSKGLATGYGYGAPEHVEVADTLFSREVPADPTRTEDVDWERGL